MHSKTVLRNVTGLCSSQTVCVRASLAATRPRHTSSAPPSAPGASCSRLGIRQYGTIQHRRCMSGTSAARVGAASGSKGESSTGELIPSTLSQSEYERISEEDMETLNETLSELCEEATESGGQAWEVEYSSGVLTLSVPPHGTYVLNKQPPNQQIWISSPVSGPCRFGYVAPDTPASSSSAIGNTQTNTPSMGSGASEETELRGAWTHFRKKGVTLGGLVEGELRSLGAGTERGEGWLGVGIK